MLTPRAFLRLKPIFRGLTTRCSYPTSSGQHGSLSTDYTFKRLLGTPGYSEPILVDLINAWRCALHDETSPLSPDSIEIIATKVRDGSFPRSEGELLVDVHAASNDSDKYILEVQRGSQKCYPQRDSSQERMKTLKQTGNRALSREMKTRMSLTFAILPHAPRLEDLTLASHPMHRWASLIAYCTPTNIDMVPRDVRSIVDGLHGTEDETEKERLLEETELLKRMSSNEDNFDAGLRQGIEQGIIEQGIKRGFKQGIERGFEQGFKQGFEQGFKQGFEQGKVNILRALKINSVDDYWKIFHEAPPPNILPHLKP